MLASHRQVDRIYHDTIPSPSGSLRLSIVARNVAAAEKTLVIGRVVLLVETGGKAEVREFDVTQRVNEDVIGFNVTMDETKIMHSLNSQDTFGHVELGDVLRESVVFDEPIYGQLKLYISF